jgi:hypothetical protein
MVSFLLCPLNTANNARAGNPRSALDNPQVTHMTDPIRELGLNLGTPFAKGISGGPVPPLSAEDRKLHLYINFKLISSGQPS